MTDASRKAIVLGQLAGAVLAAFGLRAGLVLPGAIPRGAQLLTLAFAAVALLGALMLLTRRPLGAWLSLLVQVVQIVAVTGPGDTFWFLAGPVLGLRVGGGGVRLEMGVGGGAGATLLTGPYDGFPGAYFNLGAGLRPTDPAATMLFANAFALLAAISLSRHLVGSDEDAEPVQVQPDVRGS